MDIESWFFCRIFVIFDKNELCWNNIWENFKAYCF